MTFDPVPGRVIPGRKDFMGYGFKLIRSSITEYYTAANGDHVSITVHPDDTATLIICRPVDNRLDVQKTFKTRRGALIAMHRKCGKCEFNSMTSTFRKGE